MTPEKGEGMPGGPSYCIPSTISSMVLISFHFLLNVYMSSTLLGLILL